MLFAIKFFRKWGLLFIPYNMALWFSVLYLGHHWVIDVLAGIALATLSYVLMELAWPKIRRLATRATRSRTPARVEAVAPGWVVYESRYRGLCPGVYPRAHNESRLKPAGTRQGIHPGDTVSAGQ